MQIWDSVPKPQAHKETLLSEFFNVRCYNFRQDKLRNVHFYFSRGFAFGFMFGLLYLLNGQVQVTALSSYEEKEELFKEQVRTICIYDVSQGVFRHVWNKIHSSMQNSPFCLFFLTFVSEDIKKKFQARKSSHFESFHCFDDLSFLHYLMHSNPMELENESF